MSGEYCLAESMREYSERGRRKVHARDCLAMHHSTRRLIRSVSRLMAENWETFAQLDRQVAAEVAVGVATSLLQLQDGCIHVDHEVDH